MEKLYYLKRIIKKILAYTIYISGVYYVADKLISLFCEKGLYIFLYHRIAIREDQYYDHNLSVKRENFIKQLIFFKKKFHCISMTEATKLLDRKPPIQQDFAVITFDDGYVDNFVYGIELFKEFGIKPTVYIAAGAMDKLAVLWTDIIDGYMLNESLRKHVLNYFRIKQVTKIKTAKEIFEHAEKIKNKLKKLPYEEVMLLIENLGKEFNEKDFQRSLMKWEEVNVLKDLGVEIGSHTLNHVNLSAAETKELVKEVVNSKQLIQEKTGAVVTHFAYPYGKYWSFNNKVINCVKEHYQTAVTAIQGINRLEDNVYTLKRIIISQDESLIVLKVRLLYMKIKILYIPGVLKLLNNFLRCFS